MIHLASLLPETSHFMRVMPILSSSGLWCSSLHPNPFLHPSPILGQVYLRHPAFSGLGLQLRCRIRLSVAAV